MERWTIKQMEYLVSVAESGSISAASVLMHVTQPAMSKAIMAMEEVSGYTLFERRGRRVRLTDAGEVVYRHSRKLLDGLRDLDVELEELASWGVGSLYIGVPPMVGVNFFPHILAGFRSGHPGISIQLAEYGAARVESEVVSGTLDCGVSLLPLESDDLDYFPFKQERLMVVTSQTHRLAGRTSVDMAELADDHIILYTEDFSLHKRIKEACRNAGFEPKVAWQSSQWDFIAELAREGLGIAFLPEPVCQELNLAEIAVIALINPIIPWHLALVWRSRRYLSFACREFICYTRERLEHR